MTQPLRLVHASDLHLELPALRPGRDSRPSARAVDRSAVPRGRAGVRDRAGRRCRCRAVGRRRAERRSRRAAGHRAVARSICAAGERNIPIYWAGGAVDVPDAWPRSVTLPENVHVFPVGRVESLDLARAGETIARVQGTSCREDGTVDARGFHRDAHGLFTIGVAYGTNDSAGHEGDRVHYMALGGRHQQQTVDVQPGIAHYCGTPQGRGPKETGPHGCTVVTVDETRRAKTKFVATDTVRWIDQAMEVTATTEQEQLHDRMVERLEKLQAQHPGIDLFVRWNIRGTGPLVNRLRPNSLADELLVDLRRQFGERSPDAWSVVDHLRIAAQRAGRMVRPGNLPGRFPARRPRFRNARNAVRPAALSAAKTSATNSWNAIATIETTESRPRTALPRVEARRRSADAAPGRRRHTRRVDESPARRVASRLSSFASEHSTALTLDPRSS